MSRYDGTKSLYDDAKGNSYLGLREFPEVQDYIQYQIVFGDRLDILAQRFFGNSELWWQICDANPEVIDFPLDLPIGEFIKIPIFNGILNA